MVRRKLKTVITKNELFNAVDVATPKKIGKKDVLVSARFSRDKRIFVKEISANPFKHRKKFIEVKPKKEGIVDIIIFDPKAKKTGTKIASSIRKRGGKARLKKVLSKSF